METGRTLDSTASVHRRLVIAFSTAALTAGVTAMALPSSVFQASAIIAVDEPSAALRFAAARSAADLAVSKPVIARAASSLNGTVVAPTAALAERLGVVTGLAGATGAVARLADALVPTVSASAGDGLVEVRARAADGARASRVATALAEALVAEEEGSAAAAAGRRELSATARTDLLRGTASAAHANLAALGGSEIDPVDALAVAAAATRAAEARLVAVHAVIAAGTPPLGAGRELPQSAAALQQTYWDLKKQLDKASESMGERHTTVIALRDGVARAAAALTADWQRIERAAAGEATVARSREAVLRKSATVDPTKRAAVDAARTAARLADAALARAAVAPVVAAFANAPLRLVAPAAVPASAVGLDGRQRGAISGGAGIGGFALAWLLARRRNRLAAPARRADPASSSEAENARTDRVAPPVIKETKASPVTSVEPAFAVGEATSFVAARRAPVDLVEDPVPARVSSLQPDYDFFASEWPDDAAESVDDERIAAMPFETASFDADPHPSLHRGASSHTIDPDLRDALRAIAADLAVLASGRTASAIVMVAANAAGTDTGAVALAVGEAAAELGYRVLVIEGDRARSTLAEAVAPDGDPLIVDAFGALRVALPAERFDGLFLAPALRDGARIAAALARNTQAELVDDLAAAFDAVVIDGGRAADSAAAGWTADAYIRVGRFASHKDDAYLLDAFDAPPEALLGTVAAGRFVARETAPEPQAAKRPNLRAVPASPDVSLLRRPATAPSSPLRVPPRRRVSAR